MNALRSHLNLEPHIPCTPTIQSPTVLMRLIAQRTFSTFLDITIQLLHGEFRNASTKDTQMAKGKISNFPATLRTKFLL